MQKPVVGSVSVDIPGNPSKHIDRPLAGWEVLGEVTDRVGTGALVRETSCGIYARANRYTITSLPQEEVRAAMEKAVTKTGREE